MGERCLGEIRGFFVAPMKSPKVPSKDLLVGRYYGSDIYQSADKTFFFAVANGKTVVCQSLKGLIREVAKRRKAKI